MWLKIQLYILSLWLLFLLIFLNKVPLCFGECELVDLKSLFVEHSIVLSALLFMIIGAIFYFRFRNIVSGSKSIPERVIEIDNLNWEHLTFLSTYLIPLLCFDLDFNLDQGRNGVMLILVIVAIGMIYVKTNIFYSNPTLAILGYRIYKISTENRRDIIVLSKDKLKIDDWIRARNIEEDIYFIIKTQP